MFTFKRSARVAQGALLFSVLLTFAAASSLSAQQSAIQAPAVTAAAPAAPVATVTPAPAASPLFAQDDARPVTLEAAKVAHEASLAEGSHTIVVSTLVLVLGIIIIVLLID
jgi:hypothetical protein